VFFFCCDSVALPQETVWTPAWAADNLSGRKRVATHLMSVLLLLRQCRIVARNDLGTGTTIKNVRRC
jgi:hypothetical protein